MLYTTDQVVDMFRSDVADRADVDAAGQPRDTLWSDADVLRYLNSALARWASDTLAVRRRFEFHVLADSPLVRVPFNEVIEIIEVNFAMPSYGTHNLLDEFNLDDGLCVDDYGIRRIVSPNLQTTGVPSNYTRDWDDMFMRIYPVPVADGTLEVHAYVVPMEMYAGMPLPSAVAQKDIDLILQWMKNLAYRKQDADVLDLERADSFKNEYLSDIKDRKNDFDRARRSTGIMRTRGLRYTTR